MSGVTAADLLQLGGSIFSSASAASTSRADRRQQQRQFDAQMDESVQRRVADATAAGIHPLFALGASVGASPTLTGGTKSTGSGIGDAVSRLGERLAMRKLNDAQLRRENAAAAKDEAETLLINSETKRLQQSLDSRGRDGASVKTFPLETIPLAAGQEVVYGPAQYVAPRIPTSKKPGVTSGTVPATTDHLFPDGQVLNTYSEAMQADELKQIDIAIQRGIFKSAKAFYSFLRKKKWKGTTRSRVIRAWERHQREKKR